MNRIPPPVAVVALALLFCSPGHAQGIWGGAADPSAVSGHNGDTGTYAFATGRGVKIIHSTDLKKWDAAGRVFAADVPAWAKKAVPAADGIWAPDISFHDGLYYLYYSVSSFGSQHSVIGLAVNRRLEPGNPDNHWDDRGLVLESFPGKCDYNAIDPAMFVAADGHWTLFFGSFWGGIKAVALDAKTGKPASDKPVILPIAKRAADVPEAPIEGVYVIKRDDWYYLFASWDHCCNGAASDYKVVVGRSHNALGPYLDQSGKSMLDGGGTPILISDEHWAGPGHNGILQTEHGDFIVHHAFRRDQPKLGRLFLIRPLTWSAAGWPSCGEPLNKP
ncbi:MAG: arabinan endo-1,5-alpha-L-arabinosidase [Verrucomicrobiota bacterium]